MTDSWWGNPSTWVVLGGAFAVAIILGHLLAASRYCSLGAISDVLLIGDSRRLRMWCAGAGIGMIGTACLVCFDGLDLATTMPPYASAHFAWLRYTVGGLAFGIGMHLAAGCASRQLLRLGGGSLKAGTSLVAAGVCAAWLLDGGGYQRVLKPWLDVAAVEFAAPPRLGGLPGGPLSDGLPGLAIGALLLLMATGRRGGRLRHIEWAGSLGLGFAVIAGWWLTGGSPGRAWQEDMAFLEAIPRGVGTQSYTFVAPLADLVNVARGRGGLGFGLSGAIGLVGGSLLWHWRCGRLRLERHRQPRDWVRSVVGGVLLGTGGVTALGCTVGQGLSGLSTLALGSLLATASTIAGVALAVTVEYRYGSER